MREGRDDGRWFDAVIPMSFPVEEFPFRAEKEPFALFVGRLTTKKGLEIAGRAAQAAGLPLKVIGHGATDLVPAGAEYLGALPSPERNEWMSRAQVCIFPTIYSEPFGAVAVEAQLCGTPVVASDFGGFVETVEHGKTGYLCNYIGNFADGLKRAASLDPHYIRERAVRLYSIESVAQLYQAYFERLMLLWDEGFDSLKVA
jgi:glycosyltransferase involved in cell wall biosynthesis